MMRIVVTYPAGGPRSTVCAGEWMQVYGLFIFLSPDAGTRLSRHLP